MAHRVWQERGGRIRRWKHKGRVRGEYRGLLWSEADRWNGSWLGRKFYSFHYHEPRWYNAEFFIRPERSRIRQLLHNGQYQQAELECHRTWRHRGRWDWV